MLRALSSQFLKSSTALSLALSLGLQTTLMAQPSIGNLKLPQLAKVVSEPTEAAAPKKTRLGEGIIATVNDQIISSYDLRQRLLLLVVTSGVQISDENYQNYEQQALRNLIDEHLELQEMKRFDVKVQESEIDEEIERMAGQSGMNATQLTEALRGSGIDIRALRSQIKASSGWNMLVNGRFRSKARVGEDQVDAVMQKITLDGQKPQYAVAKIYLDPASNGGYEQAQIGAQQLYDQLIKGTAPFQAVARQFSNAPSAAQGGDEGWVVSGSIDPHIENTLQMMKKGELSKPIFTEDGIYIYYLRDKSDGTADAVVSLKQASIELPKDADEASLKSAEKSLNAFRLQVRGCQNPSLSDLADSYSEPLRALKENESTAPLRTPLALTVLYVCDKRLAGDNAPTKDLIERRMVEERVSMLGRRYLRDIRNTATIETK
jgi:peptidyl-prolyl cis-trans isomerase SurA